MMSFDPFTAEARSVVVGSGDAADSLRHRWIGTEHLLLALTSEKVTAPGAHLLFQELGVAPRTLNARLLDVLRPGDAAATTEHKILTPRFRLVIAHASQVALKVGSRQIGTEHVLTALVAEPDGVAVDVLRAAGVAYDAALALLRSGRVDVSESRSPEPTWDVLPMTAAALLALEVARQWAEADGEVPVSTRHLLLALTVPGSVAARTLASMGITYESLQRTFGEVGGAEPDL